MRLVPLALTALLAALPASSFAAPATGFAYDSVVKFSPSDADPATIAPGDFAADYAAASAVPKATGGGGIFGFGKALASLQNAAAMFKNGTATRTYIAGSKERTETPALQTATITDCAARTITTLDLAKKTYSVVSMDTAMKAMTGAGGGKPGPAPTDDGTRVAIAVTTSALGAKTVAGTPTSAYDADIKMTATKPSGESSSTDMTMVGYYTATTEPSITCPGSPLGKSSSAGPNAQMMAQYFLAMKALKTPKGDPRFTVSQSGPPLPSGKFSMFNVVAMKSPQGKGSFEIIEERGNARAIAVDDAAFSVPADFTKVDGN